MGKLLTYCEDLENEYCSKECPYDEWQDKKKCEYEVEYCYDAVTYWNRKIIKWADDNGRIVTKKDFYEFKELE